MKNLLIPGFMALSLLTAQNKGPNPTPKKPAGVTMPGVQIPITALKPEAVFEVPGTPDWIAVDENVWVSNKPRNSVARLDFQTNKVVEMVTVGNKPCSGLAAAF